MRIVASQSKILFHVKTNGNKFISINPYLQGNPFARKSEAIVMEETIRIRLTSFFLITNKPISVNSECNYYEK